MAAGDINVGSRPSREVVLIPILQGVRPPHKAYVHASCKISGLGNSFRATKLGKRGPIDGIGVLKFT